MQLNGRRWLTFACSTPTLMMKQSKSLPRCKEHTPIRKLETLALVGGHFTDRALAIFYTETPNEDPDNPGQKNVSQQVMN
ncbi:hypothetical protein BCY86_02310 [Pajaroellobacter abortibovis]|uniref:Uncharacterized protein n=1 Tax=Pajaroellobacter abortibovis TaxID=1882918 RepID=A0A1L6MW28_9BACT|nr:hypothetical protein BCY86_02310 [Pajaroellobacter abortibovis]